MMAEKGCPHGRVRLENIASEVKAGSSDVFFPRQVQARNMEMPPPLLKRLIYVVGIYLLPDLFLGNK